MDIKTDYMWMRWSEAQVKDLKPNMLLYRAEDNITYTALLNKDKTFEARSSSLFKHVENAFEHGDYLSSEEAFKKFPILKKAGYTTSTEGFTDTPPK